MNNGSTRSQRSRTIAYHDENGQLHRWDGPALIYPEGWERWYIHGRKVYEIFPTGTVFLWNKNGDPPAVPYSYEEKDTK